MFYIFFIFLIWFVRYILIPLFFHIYNFYYKIPKFNPSLKIIKNCEEWVIVTGCTDGIGKAYCYQFASVGKSLILLSRSEEKLKNLQKDLIEKYNCKVMYHVVDFKYPDVYEDIRNFVGVLNIGILVNNVGMTQSYPKPFIELDEGDTFLQDILNCNVLSYLEMSKIVAPIMVENRGGVIINISSASTLVPTPSSLVYSSTKCAVAQFSRSLEMELSKFGIIVQTVLPFFVQTKFIGKFTPPSFLTPNADEFVASAIQTIGVEKETFGTVSHTIQGVLTESAPFWLKAFVTRLIYKMRARACKPNV